MEKQNEMNGKKRMSNKKFKAIWISILSVVLVLTLVVNILLNVFNGYVDLYLGGGDIEITNTEGTEDWDSEYYTNDYDSAETLAVAASEMVEKVEGEGIVLLKNNGALPLVTSADNKTGVTLLGRDAADPIYGGSGSGSVNMSSVIDFKTGLQNANYEINETVYSILVGYTTFTEEDNMFGGKTRIYDNPKANIVMDNPEASEYYIGEMPVENYTDEAVASFTTYGDAALIMYGRGGGEGGDLGTDMDGWDENYEKGQHQLELNYDEKQLLTLAKENFETVIVIINSSNVMELGSLEEDDQVDAVLWIGAPGQTGFNAVGDVLNGTINPSGRTADIYPADLTADPTFVNFGFYQYSNIDESNATGNAYFVQYEEGIYYGYRYYETAAVEGFIDYDEAVVYPFGYGLSYTTFDWEIADQKLGDVDGEISVDVKVTNTGDTAGKDVVELYYSAPYNKGGIEKSEVVLGGFAKTGELAPGKSETVTLTIAVEDMASYDYENEEAYVLENGDYDIRIQTNSHNNKEGIEPFVYSVDKTIVYSGDNNRTSDTAEVTNQFDDVSAIFTDTATEGYVTNMSRADFAGTFPTTPEEADMIANDDIIAGFQAYVAGDNEDSEAVMPTTGANNGLSLIDLRGVDYDDESWDLMLDQITPADVTNIILNGAYNTRAIDSIGKPVTTDLDGPAGISAFMGDLSCTAYPSAVVMASTFNVDLIYELGVMIGNESLASETNGWYAPAMNIHRSQFAGRNFEYYSEDGVLAGKIGAACVSGTASKGLYAFIKHYALNDQETNRVNNGVSTWANEQAIREIYLKPFEITVKESTNTIKYISDLDGTVSEKEINGCTAVMSSFNRVGATWAGGSDALMQTVLRDEWGFEGMVISDFNLYPYMYTNQGISAGTDVMLTFDSMKTIEDASSATAVSDLRKSAHRILYTVANSNAMNDIVPGSVIHYNMSTWRKVQIASDIMIAIFLIAGFTWVVIRVRKNKEKVIKD